jgi:hypothetical protein
MTRKASATLGELTTIRPDRCPALAAFEFHVLMLLWCKVSGSWIEKSIDIVSVITVRKSHNQFGARSCPKTGLGIMLSECRWPSVCPR